MNPFYSITLQVPEQVPEQVRAGVQVKEPGQVRGLQFP